MKIIKVIIADINDFKDYREELKGNTIPLYLKKYNELSLSKEKLQELVTGMLLREYLSVIEDEDIIVREYGKPFLRRNDLYYSVSHSEDIVALAISDVEVGFDIEKTRKYHEDIANKCFDKVTRKILDHLEGLEKDRAFTSYWTKLESRLKLNGQGFSDGFADLNFESTTITEQYNDYYMSVSTYGRDKIETNKLFIKHFNEICSSKKKYY